MHNCNAKSDLQIVTVAEVGHETASWYWHYLGWGRSGVSGSGAWGTFYRQDLGPMKLPLSFYILSFPLSSLSVIQYLSWHLLPSSVLYVHLVWKLPSA